MPIPTAPHSFTLTDADGAPHDYVVCAHPGSSGRIIANHLLAAAARPLLAAVGSAMGRREDGQTRPSLGADDVLRVLDAPEVADAVANAITGLPDHVFVSTFAHTTRDGLPLTAARLSMVQTGNYAELLEAFLEVVKYNGFFDSAAMLRSVKRRLLPGG